MTLDKISKANALDVQAICKGQDWDLLLTLDGGERSGKSAVGADLKLVWEPETNHDIACGIFDSFLARYCWSWDDWYQTLRDSQAMCVIREESDFLGRESMTETNRRILRILTTVGRRNNEMVLLFPDFWRLDLYARERTRVRGFVHARNLGNSDGPTRGFVQWYVRQRYPFPRSADGATIWWLRAGTGRFTHMKETSELHNEAWSKFREIEERMKNRVLENSAVDPRKAIAIRLKERGMTIREIAELIGMSKSRVGELVSSPPSLGGQNVAMDNTFTDE